MKLENDTCGEVDWTINNWKDTHKLVVAAETSCHVEVGNPKIRLRFFLRPKEKLVTTTYDGSSSQRINKWYSLWTEVQTQVDQNDAIKVTATASNLFTKGNNREIGSNPNVLCGQRG